EPTKIPDTQPTFLPEGPEHLVFGDRRRNQVAHRVGGVASMPGSTFGQQKKSNFSNFLVRPRNFPALEAS
ncbi:hypothetical protein, partial [uncultured Sphingomonas sp.]|uniref:hypothetical protein n=1 Tax=uncultured Sphingomonas sp. TaxID=158754 RepID=UPI0025E3B8C7